jgi:hypothetical protein
MTSVKTAQTVKEKLYLLENAPDNSKIPLEEPGFFNNLFFGFINKVVNTGEKFPYQYSMLFGVREDILYERDAVDFDQFMQEKLVNGEKFTIF